MMSVLQAVIRGFSLGIPQEVHEAEAKPSARTTLMLKGGPVNRPLETQAGVSRNARLASAYAFDAEAAGRVSSALRCELTASARDSKWQAYCRRVQEMSRALDDNIRFDLFAASAWIRPSVDRLAEGLADVDRILASRDHPFARGNLDERHRFEWTTFKPFIRDAIQRGVSWRDALVFPPWVDMGQLCRNVAREWAPETFDEVGCVALVVEKLSLRGLSIAELQTDLTEARGRALLQRYQSIRRTAVITGLRESILSMIWRHERIPLVIAGQRCDDICRSEPTQLQALREDVACAVGLQRIREAYPGSVPFFDDLGLGSDWEQTLRDIALARARKRGAASVAKRRMGAAEDDPERFAAGHGVASPQFLAALEDLEQISRRLSILQRGGDPVACIKYRFDMEVLFFLRGVAHEECGKATGPSSLMQMAAAAIVQDGYPMPRCLEEYVDLPARLLFAHRGESTTEPAVAGQLLPAHGPEMPKRMLASVIWQQHRRQGWASNQLTDADSLVDLLVVGMLRRPCMLDSSLRLTPGGMGDHHPLVDRPETEQHLFNWAILGPDMVDAASAGREWRENIPRWMREEEMEQLAANLAVSVFDRHGTLDATLEALDVPGAYRDTVNLRISLALGEDLLERYGSIDKVVENTGLTGHLIQYVREVQIARELVAGQRLFEGEECWRFVQKAKACLRLSDAAYGHIPSFHDLDLTSVERAALNFMVRRLGLR